MQALYVGFEVDGNYSKKIVCRLSDDELFLTNSYNGLKKDIDHINGTYDVVDMFGLEKRLKGNVRIDCVAQRGEV